MPTDEDTLHKHLTRRKKARTKPRPKVGEEPPRTRKVPYTTRMTEDEEERFLKMGLEMEYFRPPLQTVGDWKRWIEEQTAYWKNQPPEKRPKSWLTGEPLTAEQIVLGRVPPFVLQEFLPKGNYAARWIPGGMGGIPRIPFGQMDEEFKQDFLAKQEEPPPEPTAEEAKLLGRLGTTGVYRLTATEQETLNGYIRRLPRRNREAFYVWYGFPTFRALFDYKSKMSETGATKCYVRHHIIDPDTGQERDAFLDSRGVKIFMGLTEMGYPRYNYLKHEEVAGKLHTTVKCVHVERYEPVEGETHPLTMEIAKLPMWEQELKISPDQHDCSAHLFIETAKAGVRLRRNKMEHAIMAHLCYGPLDHLFLHALTPPRILGPRVSADTQIELLARKFLDIVGGPDPRVRQRGARAPGSGVGTTSPKWGAFLYEPTPEAFALLQCYVDKEPCTWEEFLREKRWGAVTQTEMRNFFETLRKTKPRPIISLAGIREVTEEGTPLVEWLFPSVSRMRPAPTIEETEEGYKRVVDPETLEKIQQWAIQKGALGPLRTPVKAKEILKMLRDLTEARPTEVTTATPIVSDTIRALTSSYEKLGVPSGGVDAHGHPIRKRVGHAEARAYAEAQVDRWLRSPKSRRWLQAIAEDRAQRSELVAELQEEARRERLAEAARFARQRQRGEAEDLVAEELEVRGRTGEAED